MELGKTCFFENTKAGFHSFLDWINQLVKGCKLNQVIVGMEPTGHYWLNLLKENNIKFVSVNALHDKRSKELDDNSPTKNDVKDAKVIAQLVKDGRYAEPTIPQGIMQNSEWQKNFAIFSMLTYRSFRDKFIFR